MRRIKYKKALWSGSRADYVGRVRIPLGKEADVPESVAAELLRRFPGSFEDVTAPATVTRDALYEDRMAPERQREATPPSDDDRGESTLPASDDVWGGTPPAPDFDPPPSTSPTPKPKRGKRRRR
jgi:hypothetical protein